MDNEIYKQHDFIFLTCMCAFCNAFGNNDTSQTICMSTNCSISSFVHIPYIGAFFIHKSPWSCSLPWFWNLVMKKMRNMLKKIMISCNKFVGTRCFMIVISYVCDTVNSYQFCYMNRLEVFHFIWEILFWSM